MRKKEHISSPAKLATLPMHRERMNRLRRLWRSQGLNRAFIGTSFQRSLMAGCWLYYGGLPRRLFSKEQLLRVFPP